MEIIEVENINEIKALWQELNKHHMARSKHFKGYFSQNTFEGRLSKLNYQSIKIYMAIEDIPVGYIVATIDDDNRGEIESLFLSEAYRGSGTASDLMTKALTWLKNKQVHDIKLVVASGNEDVFKFYEKFGFQVKSHVLYKQG